MARCFKTASTRLAPGWRILPRGGRCARPIRGPHRVRLRGGVESHLRRGPDGPSALPRRKSLTMFLLLRASRRLRCDWRTVARRAGLPALQDAPACRQRDMKRRTQSSRVLAGCRVSQADAERHTNAGSRNAGGVISTPTACASGAPPSASTSVRAFELRESARSLCAACQMGIELDGSRRGSGRA